VAVAALALLAVAALAAADAFHLRRASRSIFVKPAVLLRPAALPASRLMRGYGPLFAVALLFLLMAALVPTVGSEVKTVAVAGSSGPAAHRPPGRRPATGRRPAATPPPPTAPATTAAVVTDRLRATAARGGSAGAARSVTARRRGPPAARPAGIVHPRRQGRRRPGPDRRLRHPQGPGGQRPLLPALCRLLG